MPSENNNEIGVEIGDSYVVVWPRNMNESAIVDLDIRPNPTVTVEISMSAPEAVTLRDALTAAIDKSREIAARWKPLGTER
jgi:hypothetical protein